MVMLHAVFSKVQVSRILGEAQESVQRTDTDSQDPECPHRGLSISRNKRFINWVSGVNQGLQERRVRSFRKVEPLEPLSRVAAAPGKYLAGK